MEELGEPKAHHRGKKPGEGKAWEGEAKPPQKKANEDQNASQVQEPEKGAKEGVVGEAPVPKDPRIWPPKEAKEAPTPGRTTLRKIQVRGKEKGAGQISQG